MFYVAGADVINIVIVIIVITIILLRLFFILNRRL